MQQHPDLTLESYWPHGGIEVIPGFFYLAHVVNEGAAWGIFRGFRYGFIVLAVAALAAIYFFRHSLLLKKKPSQFAFGLLCGGILGNLCDRLRLGWVVDFLDFHLPGYRWPAFNIADSAITLGVIFYIILSLFFYIEPKEEEREGERNNPPPPPEEDAKPETDSDS